MIAKQPQDEFPTLQAAIYGVALSLDSFLLNGIAYGVLQHALFPGFLEKTADNLRRDLARLEEEVRVAPEANQPDVKACMVPLVERCRELIDLVTGLIPFRTQPHHQLRSQVLRIPLLRRSAWTWFSSWKCVAGFRSPSISPARASQLLLCMIFSLTCRDFLTRSGKQTCHRG